MREFFSLEGPFNRYGGFVADTLILSLMWIFFSIPLVTVGASTTAIFFVATRRLSNREGYITSDFWLAFKQNFARATIAWLVIVAVVLLVIFNILNVDLMGGMRSIIFPAQILFLIQIAFVTTYIFPILARFDMGIKEAAKSSFFMANRHMLTSITCVVMLATLVFGVLYAPIIAFAAPGVYAMLASGLIMRVFRRYRPEIDPDPVVEIARLEAERADARRKERIRAFEATQDAPPPGNEITPPAPSFVWIDGRMVENPQGGNEMKAFVCNVCAYVYDAAAEGAAFDALPDDWACPVCAVGKEEFGEQ